MTTTWTLRKSIYRNFKSNTLFINRKELNINIINKLKNEYNIIKDDISLNNKQLITQEKQQLLNTVNSITEEVFTLNTS